MMLTKADIEQCRSPRALREFVLTVKETVRKDDIERHRGALKKGLYKKFLDKIVPLSCFAVVEYPESYQVLPVLGNQAYDARVLDEHGREVDRIEVTAPGDGAGDARDAQLTVRRGYGEIHIGKPGDDFKALFPHALDTCCRKAMKDYSDCTLVVAIEPLPAFTGFEPRYEAQISALAREIGLIKFRAKRVVLLVLPDTLVRVDG